ncbi:MAG: hypothetical protein JXA24_05635 [Proteobacteria bacterium]|nr:hypothetical protein [Pseudomonadota bacterium]
MEKMFKMRAASLLLAALFIAGCYNPFSGIMGLFGGGGESEDERQSVLPSRVADPAAKLLLAVGGVADGRDEIIITEASGDPRDFSGATLTCVSDKDIVRIVPRPGFSTEAAGSGVRIIPTAPGVTGITCAADGEALGLTYEVTVPPQSLIQILVAEAGGEIAGEAQVDEGSGLVTEASESPTAQALGSVIRNRIWFTNNRDKVELFKADPDEYDSAPPASYYDAVIFADGQFAPASPSDPNHAVFLDAERRIFLGDDDLTAYDQAVITAGGIFNGDMEDNTTGAFAFYSPNSDQWQQLSLALSMYYYDIPDGAGVSDDDYPAMEPVQVLIHPDVPRGGGIPSFVFVRMRTDSDFAVVDQI